MSQFVDRIQIKVRGGNGGHGCMSFRREKYVPKGGPDGGDGGNGGNVVLQATESEQSLVALKFLNHYEADNGQHGMGKQRHGRNGGDVVVRVPVGTLVRRVDDPEGTVLIDLAHDGQEYIAARGGRGGRGNTRFVSSVNRAPRRAEEGKPGEEAELDLELKIIADVGLVGYPNAGKSTLLEATTNAHPETAAYPFTTLTPNVGIVEFDDFSRLTIADIPGLVEGAHDNVGLGHDFLRHIERTRVLLYVLDMAGTDDRDPLDDLIALRHELDQYQDGLSRRGTVIVANKMDEPASQENLERLKATTDLPVYPVCAVLADGTDALLGHLKRLLEPQAK